MEVIHYKKFTKQHRIVNVNPIIMDVISVTFNECFDGLFVCEEFISFFILTFK